MKKFNNAEDAFEWAKEVIEKGCVTAEEVVAEEIYKDSNEFTYRETGEMYKSGETHSRFKEGIITERTPYVRRRYYEGGKAGADPLPRALLFCGDFPQDQRPGG